MFHLFPYSETLVILGFTSHLLPEQCNDTPVTLNHYTFNLSLDNEGPVTMGRHTFYICITFTMKHLSHWMTTPYTRPCTVKHMLQSDITTSTPALHLQIKTLVTLDHNLHLSLYYERPFKMGQCTFHACITFTMKHLPY